MFNHIDHFILKLWFPPNEYKWKREATLRIVEDIGQWVLSSRNGVHIYCTTALEISMIALISEVEHLYILGQAILLIGIYAFEKLLHEYTRDLYKKNFFLQNKDSGLYTLTFEFFLQLLPFVQSNQNFNCMCTNKISTTGRAPNIFLWGLERNRNAESRY